MTPRGTKHFISVDYPQIFVSESQQEDVKPVANYHPEEPKYETVVTGDLDGKPKGNNRNVVVVIVSVCIYLSSSS